MKLKMIEGTLAPSNFILEYVELGLRDAARHDRLRKVERCEATVELRGA